MIECNIYLRVRQHDGAVVSTIALQQNNSKQFKPAGLLMSFCVNFSCSPRAFLHLLGWDWLQPPNEPDKTYRNTMS